MTEDGNKVSGFRCQREKDLGRSAWSAGHSVKNAEERKSYLCLVIALRINSINLVNELNDPNDSTITTIPTTLTI
jgi:hypothetical protein